MLLFFFSFFFDHFYYPALIRRKVFTLSGLAGLAVVTQVSSLLPPGTLHFLRGKGSAFSLLVDFHRLLLTHALALSATHFVFKRKPPTIIHLMRREPTNFVLAGTRATTKPNIARCLFWYFLGGVFNILVWLSVCFVLFITLSGVQSCVSGIIHTNSK